MDIEISDQVSQPSSDEDRSVIEGPWSIHKLGQTGLPGFRAFFQGFSLQGFFLRTKLTQIVVSQGFFPGQS